MSTTTTTIMGNFLKNTERKLRSRFGMMPELELGNEEEDIVKGKPPLPPIEKKITYSLDGDGTFQLTMSQIELLRNTYTIQTKRKGVLFVGAIYFKTAVETCPDLQAVFNQVTDAMGAGKSECLSAHATQMCKVMQHTIKHLHQPSMLAHIYEQLGSRHAELRQDGFNLTHFDTLLNSLRAQRFGDFGYVDRKKRSADRLCKWMKRKQLRNEEMELWMNIMRFVVCNMKRGYTEQLLRERRVQEQMYAPNHFSSFDSHLNNRNVTVQDPMSPLDKTTQSCHHLVLPSRSTRRSPGHRTVSESVSDNARSSPAPANLRNEYHRRSDRVPRHHRCTYSQRVEHKEADESDET